MSEDFRQKLREWAKYWNYHFQSSSALEKRVEFLEKAVEGCMDLLSRAYEDISKLEGRPLEDMGSPLYRAGKINVRGDLKRFAPPPISKTR